MSLPNNLFLLLAYLIGLYFLKKLIVTQLTLISNLLFSSPKWGFYFYAFLVFPGTFLHELSHLLTADLLGVPTGEFHLLPHYQPTIHKYTLGHVTTAKTNPFKSILIGFAPFLTGLIFLFLLASLYHQLTPSQPFWQKVIIFYGIFTISQSMFISKTDLRFWPLLLVTLVLLFWFLFRFHLLYLLDSLLFPLQLTFLISFSLLILFACLRLFIQWLKK